MVRFESAKRGVVPETVAIAIGVLRTLFGEDIDLVSPPVGVAVRAVLKDLKPGAQ